MDSLIPKDLDVGIHRRDSHVEQLSSIRQTVWNAEFLRCPEPIQANSRGKIGGVLNVRSVYCIGSATLRTKIQNPYIRLVRGQNQGYARSEVRRFQFDPANPIVPSICDLTEAHVVIRHREPNEEHCGNACQHHQRDLTRCGPP